MKTERTKHKYRKSHWMSSCRLDKILAQSYLQFSDVALCLEVNRIEISTSISLITNILLDIKI